MNHDKLINAIKSLVPDAEFVIVGDEITWVNPVEAPVTQEQIEAEIERQAVLQVWESIKAERDRRKAAGIKVSVEGAEKWFHSDDASRIQQLGLVMMGANIPANLQWKTMDGTFVTMTQVLAGQIFEAAAAHDVAVFGIAEQHRLAMEASESPADYDYSAGWPQTFEEWQAAQ